MVGVALVVAQRREERNRSHHLFRGREVMLLPLLVNRSARNEVARVNNEIGAVRDDAVARRRVPLRTRAAVAIDRKRKRRRWLHRRLENVWFAADARRSDLVAILCLRLQAV